MNSIRQRFLQAEDDFLSTLRLDNKHLVHFAERWQTLWSDWESCLPEADHDTRELVDEVVAKIEELAGDLYLLESRTVDLKDDLLNSLEDVFASLTLEDNVVAQPDPPLAAATAIISSPMQRDTISPPQWLLHNLHNPYPLPHIQFSTGRFASSKHTKGWFSKARQRIGWTRLLRDRFAGCRSLAIAAAFRAFIRDDPDNPLDDDLKTAFLAIKSHAELVYRGEVVVCKPPPKRLRSISPTPSLTFSSASEDTDEPWPTSPFESSFKRSCKRASLELSDSPSPKRRRTQSPPSPPSRPRDDLSPPCMEVTPPRSKKRRLSEGDSECSRPKRPRGMEGDRLHIVSDPLSMSTTPAWFNFDQTFQIPDPASTGPLDSASFDLDFFNPPSLPSHIDPSTPAPSNDVALSVDDISALFEIPQLDLLQQALPSSSADWTQFLNFEPDLSLFPSSPSLTSSLASTPPLIDDAALFPSSPSDSNPPSPGPLLHILPHHLCEKGIQFPTSGEPMIQGQDFLFPPGEDTGILSISALLPVH